MTANLDSKLDATWRSMRRAPPRSKRRLKLENEMVNIQLKRLRRELKGKAK